MNEITFVFAVGYLVSRAAELSPKNSCTPVIAYCIPTDPKGPYRPSLVARRDRGESDAGGVSYSLAEVKVQDGESIESALRRFKRKVQQEDIIKDIKKHSFYLKPGDRRRAKQALARKRTRKKLRREVE
jgi:small subunit ribosomal protein S21